MPTPLFTFRLPLAERESLVQMAKVFGSTHVSGFLREMIGAMCSGDPQRVQDFNAKMIRATGEQLVLKLNALVPIPAKARPVAKKRPKPRRGRRGTT